MTNEYFRTPFHDPFVSSSWLRKDPFHSAGVVWPRDSEDQWRRTHEVGEDE